MLHTVYKIDKIYEEDEKTEKENPHRLKRFVFHSALVGGRAVLHDVDNDGSLVTSTVIQIQVMTENIKVTTANSVYWFKACVEGI